MGSIVGLLLAFAPLILKLGNWFIDQSNQNDLDKAAAKKAFLDAVQGHVNDAYKSVDGRQSYKNQNDALSKIEHTEDAANAVKPTPPSKP
jgi:hypothetical protein